MITDEDTTLLTSALEILERDGWCQRRYIDSGTGKRCLVGALGAVLGQNNANTIDGTIEGTRKVIFGMAVGHPIGRAVRRISEQIDVPKPWMHSSDLGQLIAWNDESGRTYEDVVLALKKAIESY